MELLFDTRLLLPVLAPLDDDVRFMRCVLAFEAAFFAFMRTRLVRDLCADDRWGGLSVSQRMDNGLYLAQGYAVVAYAVWVMARRQTPRSLKRGLQRMVVVYSLLNILHALYEARRKTERLGEVLANLVTIYMVLSPQALQASQARLRRWMETRGATRAAAAVACLIGRAEPKEALQQARQSFRSADVSHLTFEDLRDNASDPHVNELAEPTKLGHCDAFVSHSWHDDPAAKWEALQEWRTCFRAKHGREPRVWFDKLCIDQNNIEADLRCLPISLSGCNSLLILYGPTYLSRLWCIIEIFTYIMMGGSIENIDVRLVLREASKQEDRRVVSSAFEDFDVADCQCYNPADKERILLVIGTAFGSFSAFNDAVAEALGQIKTENPVLVQLSMAAGGNP